MESWIDFVIECGVCHDHCHVAYLRYCRFSLEKARAIRSTSINFQHVSQWLALLLAPVSTPVQQRLAKDLVTRYKIHGLAVASPTPSPSSTHLAVASPLALVSTPVPHQLAVASPLAPVSTPVQHV